MMRHSVIYAAGLVEPDPSGVWVKHQEASEKISTLSMALKVQEQQMLSLEREYKSLQAELLQGSANLNAITARQDKGLKAARERLQTHGHTGNCASRLGRVSVEGSKSVGSCNCGLNQWMRENELG